MAEYLSLTEVRARADECRQEVEMLLKNPRVAMKPKSRQWRFFRESLAALLGTADVRSEFTRRQAVQYRFEVSERLRKFYLGPGRPVALVFRLVDRQEAIGLELIDETYPHLLGYVLLVAPARRELIRPERSFELREYLSSVVDRAAHAEFAVYKALPRVDLAPLEGLFVIGSPAYQRIRNLAEQHSKTGLTIAEPPYNPSTMRVTKIRVLELTISRAAVRTQEYWYLRWWSIRQKKYARIYQETNYQRYGLVLQDDRWLVETNIYPQPRAVTVRKAWARSASP